VDSGGMRGGALQFVEPHWSVAYRMPAEFRGEIGGEKAVEKYEACWQADSEPNRKCYILSGTKTGSRSGTFASAAFSRPAYLQVLTVPENPSTGLSRGNY
jgi:hypothetical protein